jgi:F0F1-type ATP synthase membrane subunit a
LIASFNPAEAVVSGNEVGEWARKIAELYMTWYTFFVVANVVVLGWICGKGVQSKEALRPLALLCVLLSLLTLGSTAMVGYTLHSVVAAPFGTLIVFAAVANAVGLVGVMYAWAKLSSRA